MILILILLLSPFSLTYTPMEGEPDFFDGDFEQLEANHILSKYDPEKKNKIKKDDYKSMLKEIIFRGDLSTISALETLTIENLIDDYVESQLKTEFTFYDVLDDLNSDKLINLAGKKLSQIQSQEESEKSDEHIENSEVINLDQNQEKGNNKKEEL